jgi:hypothetical protein
MQGVVYIAPLDEGLHAGLFRELPHASLSQLATDLQREKGDLAAESADGLRAPEAQKVPVPPKPAQTRCWPRRGQFMRRTTGRDVVRHRRDATRQRRPSASNLSV